MIRAFALHKEREIATRIWHLEGDGIYADCRCEKGQACRADNMIHRPADASRIETQLLRLIREFGEEYDVPEKKIGYLRMITGRVYESQKLSLPPIWKDPEKLAAAQIGFDKIPRR